MSTQVVDRSTGISGTDIAAIVGVSPHKTRFSVYAEKRGLVDPNIAFKQTPRMRVGKFQEPTIVRLFEEDFAPLKVTWLDKLQRHPTEELVIGSPDGVTSAEPGFEAKTAGLDQAWRWGAEDTDVVPEEYLLQAHWYMLLTQRPSWWIAALIGGDRFKAFLLHADAELGGVLLDEAKKFWRDHIVAGRQPELDHSDAAAAYLCKLYPNATPKEVREATPAELELMREYTRVQKEFKFLAQRKAGLSNQVKELIGGSYGIAGDGMKAIWYDVKGSTYSVTREPGRTLKLTDKRRSEDVDEPHD